MSSVRSLFRLSVSRVVVTLAFSTVVLAARMPDIKLNGSDGPVVLTQSDTLTVSIAMDNGGITANCDCCVAIATPAWVFLVDSSGGRTP